MRIYMKPYSFYHHRYGHYKKFYILKRSFKFSIVYGILLFGSYMYKCPVSLLYSHVKKRTIKDYEELKHITKEIHYAAQNFSSSVFVGPQIVQQFRLMGGRSLV